MSPPSAHKPASPQNVLAEGRPGIYPISYMEACPTGLPRRTRQGFSPTSPPATIERSALGKGSAPPVRIKMQAFSPKRAKRAQRTKCAKMGGPALPDRDPLTVQPPEGKTRAAHKVREDGWAGFAGPGPTDCSAPRGQNARSAQSARRWVGRLCRTGTH